MKKKKVDYLCYEARFWYVKTLDLADFKYVTIYPLASFFLEYGPSKTLKNGKNDRIFITKVGMATIIIYLKSAKFGVFMYQK